MRCPACGQENRPGARFCDACGTRLAAARALWQIGGQCKDSLPVLRELFKKEDAATCVRAAELLGDIGPPARELVPVLIDNLETDDPQLRRAVAAALKKVDPAAAAKAGIR